jgi:hypothetical protein
MIPPSVRSKDDVLAHFVNRSSTCVHPRSLSPGERTHSTRLPGGGAPRRTHSSAQNVPWGKAVAGTAHFQRPLPGSVIYRSPGVSLADDDV